MLKTTKTKPKTLQIYNLCISLSVCGCICAHVYVHTPPSKCVCVYIYTDRFRGLRVCVSEILTLHIGCKFNAGMKVLFGFSK